MNKKQWIGSGIFYGLSAFGISLTIKASVVVSSFNALNVTLATMSGIKVGTITTAIKLMAVGSAADVPQTKRQ